MAFLQTHKSPQQLSTKRRLRKGKLMTPVRAIDNYKNFCWRKIKNNFKEKCLGSKWL